MVAVAADLRPRLLHLSDRAFTLQPDVIKHAPRANQLAGHFVSEHTVSAPRERGIQSVPRAQVRAVSSPHSNF